MHRLAIASAAAFVVVAPGLGLASESSAGPGARTDRCAPVAREQFRSEAELTEAVERFGYRVIRVGADAGCYAVLADDRRGKRFDMRFEGTSLRMVTRHLARLEPESVAQR